MAKFEAPGDPADTSESSHATNPNTPEHVEAPLAKDPGERAGEVIRHEQQERGCLQEFLHDQLGFEKLNLCCDSRVRLLFKHAEGNSAIKVNPEAIRQEISAEPTGILRRPGDPLIVKLLGSLQSKSEAKCTLDVKSVKGDLYYIPNSDNAIFFNRTPSRISMKSSSGTTKKVDPWQAVTLDPASWVLSNRNDTVSLILLPRRYYLKVEEQTGTAVRRSADASLCEPVAKKAKGPAGSDARKVDSKVTSRLEKPTTIWAGVDLQENQLVQVTDRVTGHIEYSIRRLTNWAHQKSCSEAFKAIINDETSKPEVVIVKILAKPSVDKRNVISAAREWSQEFGIHRSLQHHQAEEPTCSSAVQFEALRLATMDGQRLFLRVYRKTQMAIRRSSIIEGYLPLVRTSDSNIDSCLYLGQSRGDQAALAKINGLRRPFPLQSSNHLDLNDLLTRPVAVKFESKKPEAVRGATEAKLQLLEFCAVEAA
ncbi:hypothetical protein SLS53_005160 [Cytospora paraplurivora]|uniref:PD-(D/E)XK nuclease-like domain-containing protein n=1 Tax=Cytospora paraplurivora TaxID=2898453 RepID=A0AAN9YGB0_9PEZI